MKKQSSEERVFRRLAKPVQALLQEAGLPRPTEPQIRAIPSIVSGQNVLLVAPTGSGKTEAALLPVLSMFLETHPRRGVAMLYITPLRALNRDLMKRLAFWSARLGIQSEIRHGDTPASERRRQSVRPPSLLITTPETLQAILPGKRMRQHLRWVRWVIVDEVHELAQDKRGVQLTLALERLGRLTGERFQRIGLSATVGDPKKIAQLLAGSHSPCRVVKVPVPKEARYAVEFPYPTEEDYVLAQTLYTSPDAGARISRIKELVDDHTSTLVFVNSRQHAEMLGLRLGMLDKRIAVHHGSLSRDERTEIENDFKQGALRALVCTSTLELGIDIGTVDLVIQYLSPRQVTSLIQRVGRSGHRLGRVSRGTILTAYPEDTLEAIGAVRRAHEERLEHPSIHELALDVLSHQVVGILMDEEKATEDAILSIVRRSYPYRNLANAELRSVISYLEELGMLRREDGFLRRTGRGRAYYFENLSMIPDERRYAVVDLSMQRRIGILGEEFMTLRARVGLHFICRGRVWEIRRISEDGTVYVIPVEDPTAAIPGWDGEILPVPFELAQEVGRLRGEIAKLLRVNPPGHVVEELSKRWPVERHGVSRVVEELSEHVSMGLPVPTDRLILLEGFDRFVVIHACLGEVTNRTLAFIFDEILSRRGLHSSLWTDGYRILIEFLSDVEQTRLTALASELLGQSPEEAEKSFYEYVDRRFPFSYSMKFVAERFGAIPRGLFLGDRKLTGLEARLRGTPAYAETLREAMQTKIDLPRAKHILQSIRKGDIKVASVLVRDRPSPLAFRMLNKFAEVPEMAAPESVARDNLRRVKMAIEAQRVQLFCMECGSFAADVRVGELPDRPLCRLCGSGLLAVANKVRGDLPALHKRHSAGEHLAEDEVKTISRARRTADLVLSYGKNAVVALLTWGIGPQTAAGILAKMHMKEQDFLADLLKANLKYAETRPFWGAD